MAEKQPIIDLTKYTLQKSEKSYCGHCHGLLHWLTPHERVFGIELDLPQYLMCEKCGMIAQAGVAGNLAEPEPYRINRLKSRQ